MREIRQSGSEGGATQDNASFLPLYFQRKSFSGCRIEVWKIAGAGLAPALNALMVQHRPIKGNRKGCPYILHIINIIHNSC
jgi:hypothetical protein